MTENTTVQPVAIAENSTGQPAITENSPDQLVLAEGNSTVEPNASSVEVNNGYASNVGLCCFAYDFLLFYKVVETHHTNVRKLHFQSSPHVYLTEFQT